MVDRSEEWSDSISNGVGEMNRARKTDGYDDENSIQSRRPQLTD